ncbi:MAG: hypothetical protein NVSMB6_12870 [Burkholderiaceae bacterium]
MGCESTPLVGSHVDGDDLVWHGLDKYGCSARGRLLLTVGELLDFKIRFGCHAASLMHARRMLIAARSPSN